MQSMNTDGTLLAQVGGDLFSLCLPMAKPEPQIDVFRKRLSGFLADWGTEISAVLRTLENQSALATTYRKKVDALENRVKELLELGQEARDKDLAVQHFKKQLEERDNEVAGLKEEHRRALASVEKLERELGAAKQNAPYNDRGQHAEFEAMRAELAARKTLIRSLRADAERVTALGKELEENRAVIARMKKSIDRHAETIAELRRSAESWERKYRRLADAGARESSPDDDMLSDSAVAQFLDAAMGTEADHTIAIDMTEPLREARDTLTKKRKNQ